MSRGFGRVSRAWMGVGGGRFRRGGRRNGSFKLGMNRHLGDKLVCVGHLGGGLDFVLAGALLAVGDVLGDGSREEHRLLRHEPELLAEPAHVEGADVDAVEEDAPLLRVVEALEERDHSRLAGAGGAAEGDHLPQLNLERVAVAHGHRGRHGVTKRDLLKLNLSANGRELLALFGEGIDGGLPRDGGEDTDRSRGVGGWVGGWGLGEG